jgi:high-affinity iron transporter
MLNAFAITWREGLDAFLIVAVTLAFLRRTGVRSLVSAVHSGMALSPIASAIAAYLFSRAENQLLWQGLVTLVAAACVLTLIVHLWRTARPIPGDLDVQLRRAVLRGGVGGWTALFLFTLMIVAREGMGIGLLIAVLVFQVDAANLALSAVAGLVMAAFVAWLGSHYLTRLTATLFLQVATIFLALFTAQLLISGVHDLADARVLPGADMLRSATAPYAADGVYGQYASYLLLAAPLGWLVLALFLGHGKAANGRVAHVGR